MNIFVKRMLGIMYFIIIVSFVVALASSIIFVFDINGSKGLMPMIFFSLTIYFLLSYTTKILKDSFNNKKKRVSIKSPDLALGIISGVVFILSLYVFWL